MNARKIRKYFLTSPGRTEMSTFNTIQYCIDNSIPCFSHTIKWDTIQQSKKVSFPKGWSKLTSPSIQLEKNGLALLTGITFWVLDFDNCYDDIPQNVQILLWNTCQAIVKTRRGYHFYFKVCNNSSSIQTSSGIYFIDKKWDGIDVRNKGGCIIAPPSSYIENRTIRHTYEWVKGDLSTIVEAGPEILSLMNDITQCTVLDITHKTSHTNEWNTIISAVDMLNSRRATNYNDWIAVIWALKNTENSERSLALAHDFSSRSLKMNQYNPNEVNKIFHEGKEGFTKASLFYWAMKDSPDDYFARFGMSQLEENVFRGDSGLAELYALENKNKVVCTCQNTTTLEFYIFDETSCLWKESTGNDVKTHFSRTMEDILKPLHKYYTEKINSSIGNDDSEKLWVMKRFELAKIMKHTHNNTCAKNVLPYITSVLYDRDFFIRLNKTAHLLSVANGVVDLRNGTLLKREPNHYFSYALKIHYDSNVDITDWNKYFNQVFQNDNEVIEWFQSYLGYTLTGEMNLQRIVVLWGSGSNSKSVLLGFLRRIMGSDIFQTLSMDDIRSKDGGSRDGIYQARNARMAILSETSAHAKFDEELLKGISGQDPISVAAKYKSQITYIPQFKLYIITNNKPKFDPEKEAVWRRIILVPFETAFKDIDSSDWNEELAALGKMIPRDDSFLEKLNGNLEGLLKWLVNGSIRYYNSPERIPKKLLEVAKDYKKSCNIYLSWLEQNYYKSDSADDYVTSEELIAEWRKDNLRSRDNDKAIAMKISEALKEWEITRERKRVNGELCYLYSCIRRKDE